MTKAQLIALGDELGIEGLTSSMLKAELIAAILDGQGAQV